MDEATLRAWNPSMAEYHLGPEVSSGFLAEADREGLSVALHRRALAHAVAAASPRGRPLTTDPRMGRGILMHKNLSGDSETLIWTAQRARARRGAAWEHEVEQAEAAGADAVLLAHEVEAVAGSWASLWSEIGQPLAENGGPPWRDTDAKRQIRAILKAWSPRVPEVSHRWEVLPGCWARIREDIVARAPSRMWAGFSIKTTTTPLVERHWWRFWRRWYARGDALYREGMRNLFGGEPVRRFLIVARLVPPYPWGLFDLSTRDAELDIIWEEGLLPQLREITEILACGESHGPEERGLDL